MTEFNDDLKIILEFIENSGVIVGDVREYSIPEQIQTMLSKYGNALIGTMYKHHRDTFPNEGIPKIIVSHPITPLHKLDSSRYGDIVSVEATISIGSQMGVRTAYYQYESGECKAVSEMTALTRHHKEAPQPIIEDSRDLILTEPDRLKASHDIINISADICGPYVMHTRAGERYILTGKYTTRERKIGSVKRPAPHLEVYSVQPVDITPQWTKEDEKRLALQSEDTHQLLSNLAHSISPDTGSKHFWAKISCLLSCVNSPELRDQRTNIHTLLVGPPASGKTQISKPLALKNVITPSRFIDGGGASARGLTFASGVVNGETTVTPGALVTSRLVIIDEFNKMNPESRNELNTVVESQIAIYEKQFKARSNTDVSLILSCNPADDRWNKNIPLYDNLPDTTPAFLSRFNIFLVEPADDTDDDIDTLVDYVTGDDSKNVSPYTIHDLSLILSHARTLHPKMNKECKDIIKSWLKERLGKSTMDDIDMAHGKRINVAMLRNAGGFARLLHKDEIDAECARLAVDLIEASMKNLNISTPTGITRHSGKNNVFLSIAMGLNKEFPDGWTMDVITTRMTDYPNYWATPNASNAYITGKFIDLLHEVAPGRWRIDQATLD